MVFIDVNLKFLLQASPQIECLICQLTMIFYHFERGSLCKQKIPFARVFFLT